MTPHLALTLSFDGIGLTRRSTDGWQSVGHVPLDAPDLAERLHDLRGMAEALCPEGIATAIVLPDEQILNRHLPGVAETPAAVAAALDGLTPYAVAELVFDWRPHPDGGVVVAAVARETIDEALAFARQYGFNPVALTARPAAGLPFAAEPDFGPAPDALPASVDVLPDATAAPIATDSGTDLEGQDVAAPPGPETLPDAVAPPGAAASGTGSDGFSTRRARTVVATDVGQDPAGTAPFLLERAAQPLEAPPDDPATAPSARIAALPARLTVLEPSGLEPSGLEPSGPEPLGATAPTGDQPPGQPVAEAADAAPELLADGVEVYLDATGPAGGLSPEDPDPARDNASPARASASVTAPKAESAPSASGRKPAETSPASRLVAATRTGGSTSGRPGSVGRPVGAVRRAGGVRTGAQPAGQSGRGTKSAGTAGLQRSGTDAVPARVAEPSLSARTAAATLSVRALGDPALAGSSRGMTSMPVVVGLVAALLIALAAAVGLSRVVLGWLAPSTEVVAISADAPMVAIAPVPEAAVEASRAEIAPDDAPPGVAETAAAAEPVTPAPASPAQIPLAQIPLAQVPQARDPVAPDPQTPDPQTPDPQTPDPQTPPPQTGVGRADSATTPPGDNSVVALPPLPLAADTPVPTGPSPVAPDTAAPPTGSSSAPEIAAQTGSDAGTSTGSAGPGLQGSIVPRPSPDALAAPRTAPAPLSAPDGRDTLPQVPSQFVLGPGPAPVGDPVRPAAVSAPRNATFVLSAVDPAVALQDPLALVTPGPGAARDLPEIQPPPPPGLTYRLDDRGLVVATPDGALAPEGHLVTLGRPALVPPPRPLTATPAPAVASDPATVQRLARLRPPPKPDAVPSVPVTGGAVTDGAAVVPSGSPPEGLSEEVAATGVPAALAEALSAARAPDPDTVRPLPRPASLASDVAIVPPDATPEAFASATERAIPVSLRPATRPAGLDAIAAAAAVRIAPLPSAEPTTQTPTETPQDFSYDDGEPEVASAAPRIPSSASVARQATVEGALNLRELNLIGVYGTASDRRALVRLPNGRFVKVEIGDRVDGGQVADIGDRDLRYVKGGRSIVLSMPRG